MKSRDKVRKPTIGKMFVKERKGHVEDIWFMDQLMKISSQPFLIGSPLLYAVVLNSFNLVIKVSTYTEVQKSFKNQSDKFQKFELTINVILCGSFYFQNRNGFSKDPRNTNKTASILGFPRKSAFEL